MTKKKVKRGITGFLIVGIVFTFMAVGYLVIPTAIYLLLPKGESRDEMFFLLFIFCGLGAVFLLVGGICLSIEIRKRIRCTKMLEAGNYIMAEIVEIRQCHNITINGRHPYAVICSYQDVGGDVHLFKSRYLNFDPGSLLKDQSVRVYVDSQDFKNYYVDIDEVLPNVIMH